MRIISGKYRSRIINYISDDKTRPTTDKVRGAIFNSIGPFFDGGVFLDLFSGSGAMGIEAISRGVSEAFFVDINNEAIKVIKENILKLKIENAHVWKMDYHQALDNITERSLSIVFLDPPYKLMCYEEIMEIIHQKHLLMPDGLVICEYAKENTLSSQYFDEIKSASYGIRKISYFKEKE